MSSLSLSQTKALSIACLVLLVSVLGCRDQKGREQLSDYLNQDILTISQLEQAALNYYAGVTGTNYTNDQALSETLREKVIPTYSQFVNLLEEIQPPNDDLRHLHMIYLQSAHSFQTGFAVLLAAVEKKDPDLTQRANEHITQGRQRGEQWRKEFFALCKKKGIKVAFQQEAAPSPNTQHDKWNP